MRHLFMFCAMATNGAQKKRLENRLPVYSLVLIYNKDKCGKPSYISNCSIFYALQDAIA